MKKLLLTLLVAGSAAFSFAQTRTIDWSTEEIITPTSLHSTSSGTPLSLEFVMKNNGADMALIGDSIWWQLLVTDPGVTQLIFAYPGPDQNTFSIKKLDKNVASGDTIHIALNATVSLVANQSGNVKLIVASHIVNRPDLTFEGAGTVTNNTKTSDIVWYNEQGWPVGLPTIDLNTSTKVYPIPANDILNIDFETISSGVVSIFDISGKKIDAINLTSQENKIDVSNYNVGMYFYMIQSESGSVKSGKFNISR